MGREEGGQSAVVHLITINNVKPTNKPCHQRRNAREEMDGGRMKMKRRADSVSFGKEIKNYLFKGL